jgi:hypothetical protein
LNGTDSRYYGYYQVRFPYGVSCGDPAPFVYTYSFHFSTVITYNDTNRTINFTCPIPTNTYPSGAQCDGRYDTVVSVISLLNSTKNQSNTLSLTTSLMPVGPITALWPIGQTNDSNSFTTGEWYYIDAGMVNGIFDPLALGFCYESVSKQYRLYRSFDRVTLTQPATHDTRLNNWKLERLKSIRTNVCTDNTFETVYEVITP